MTTHDPITLPASDARQLVYSGPGGTLDRWTVAAITNDDSGQWTSYHRLVIRDADGRHYAAGFERGLTEYQDTAPFEYDKEVKFRPVYPAVCMVEVTEWADQPPTPAAEFTEAQRLAKKVIHSAIAETLGDWAGMVERLPYASDDLMAAVEREIRAVRLTWDGEQAEDRR